MSFTTRVKNEISNDYSNKNANLAELSAILRNSYHKEDKILELVTENSMLKPKLEKRKLIKIEFI